MTGKPSTLSRLHLVRHGETAWSLSGQHTGRTDIPLTEQGEQDARKLAPRLRDVRFSRVFTSPLQRARRTCELAGLGEVAEIESDLAEWDYGDYEGKRPVDIHNVRPDWNVFRDGLPSILMYTSARCHVEFGLGRRLRRSAAIADPKWFTQRRTVS